MQWANLKRRESYKLSTQALLSPGFILQTTLEQQSGKEQRKINHRQSALTGQLLRSLTSVPRRPEHHPCVYKGQ